VSNFKDLRIIVVDDDDLLVKYMEAMLTQLGVGSVTTAENFYQVQDKLREGQYDGAFLDLVLQHGSGLDVGRSLKAHGIPVIYCSGVTDEYNIRQMYQIGFVFSKPITMYHLNRGLEYFSQLKSCPQ
jgi:DNA-binding response OmpR family regulator